MVQFFKGSADPRDASYGALSEALGHGLSKGITSHYANEALEKVLGDEQYKNASQSEKMGALQKALSQFGQPGQELMRNRLQIEQVAHQEQQQKLELKKQEQEQEALGKLQSGEELDQKDWSKISPQNQLKAFEFQQKKKGANSIHKAMIDAGIPKETADIYQNLYENSSTGGQTDIIKAVNDQIRRHKLGRGEIENKEKTNEETTISVPGVDIAPMPLKLPEEPQEIGVTSADKIKREDKRQAINTPKYDAAIDRLNAYEDDFKDFEYMEELNDKPDALPTGFEKWNVDWETGDLRVAALATPETQAFVKTLARQLSRAKNDFPGRVTNFDLEQFKKKFPGLANSPEGRKLILQQLKTANRIAFLKDETLKKAYDHYGSSADPMFVRKIADENYRSLKNKLETHLKSLNDKADQMSPNAETEQSKQPDYSKATSLEELFP
jgi:hypothetical protein